MLCVHRKRGTVYDTLGVALVQADQPITEGDKVMVYRNPTTGDLWVRPLHEFEDGRFKPLASAAPPHPTPPAPQAHPSPKPPAS